MHLRVPAPQELIDILQDARVGEPEGQVLVDVSGVLSLSSRVGSLAIFGHSTRKIDAAGRFFRIAADFI